MNDQYKVGGITMGLERCRSVLRMQWSWLVGLVSVIGLQALELKSKRGILHGTEETSRSGRKYYAFRSIPYAQPPVGKLRFKNPQSLYGWDGVLDATNDPPHCLQKLVYFPHLRNVTVGQQDCLYLNVYTTTTDPDKKLPVLVYVHGGGFRLGTAGPRNGPAYFMDEDVVLVTFHYRVGILGFLSTEDRLIPGNFGLKDQAMAIKWVSENIKDYGGNPDSVVVFGESAGGASVHLLITSPMTKGLLKGGISHSGTMNRMWALGRPGRQRNLAKRVAQHVGCNYYASTFLQCLQSVDAETLIETDTQFLVWDSDPSVLFQPVVEDESEDSFITEEDLQAENTLPWMTGMNSGEGNFRAASLINQNFSVTEEYLKNIDKLLPIGMLIEPDTPGLEKYMAMIKERFLSNPSDLKKHMESIEQMGVEFSFIYPMIQALRQHAGPKYAYYLSHRAENSFTDRMGPIKLNSTKACHADDLISLFDMTTYYPGTKGRPEDEKVSRLLVKLWVNFAKSQNPTIEGVDVKWDEFTNNNFLHIKTDECKMEEFQFDDVIEFWTKAFNVLNSKNERIQEEL